VVNGDGAGFAGFDNYPVGLKNLIYERIRIKYLAKKGVWDERSAKDVSGKQVLENLEIDYFDVLKSYIDHLEVIAGSSINIENDIKMPGISITYNAKNNIYTKDNLIIDTSGDSAKQFVCPKANNGKKYREFINVNNAEINLPPLPSFLEHLIKPKLIELIRTKLDETYKQTYGENYASEGIPSGSNGDNGEDGLAGQSAGHICLRAGGYIEKVNEIKFIANGGKGGNGQQAGDGDEGKAGLGTSDADVRDTAGIGRRQLNIAWARIPGQDERGEYTREKELGDKGGDAGIAGVAGHGGNRGDIIIEDREHDIRYQEGKLTIIGDVGQQNHLEQNIKSKFGNPGDKADLSEGGKGGAPGRRGLDVQKFKPSFWKGTEEIKGRIDPKIFDNPGGGRTFWDLDFSIFGTSVDKFGFCEGYRFQININGAGDEQPTISVLTDLHSKEREEAQNKAKRGLGNKDRQKAETEMKKAEIVLNIAAQASHKTYLSKKSKELTIIPRLVECNERCEKKIKNLEVEIRNYDARIQVCTEKEAVKDRQLNEISQKLETTKEQVGKLTAKKDNIAAQIQKAI
ncbi:MAG: hypothetical protein WCP46_09395, partial [Alphaproteobacteria bacterium]